MTPTPSIFSKVLPHKWEACCSTNARCIVGFPFFSKLRIQEGPAIQMGGILPYKLEVYCRTSSRPVGVGVSKTLLLSGSL